MVPATDYDESVGTTRQVVTNQWWEIRRYKTVLIPMVRVSPKARCGGSSRTRCERTDLENGVGGDSVHEISTWRVTKVHAKFAVKFKKVETKFDQNF